MIVFILIYPLGAYFGPKNGRAEFYPFFNWSLFTNASNVRTDIVLMVHELNGITLPEPMFFFDMKDQFSAAKRQDSLLAKLVDDYVATTNRNETEASSAIEEVIFQRYMPEAQSVTYDVAIIQYQPAQRYKTGEIMNKRIIRTVKARR